MKQTQESSKGQGEVNGLSLISRGVRFFSAEESHERINDTLLGPLERPALRWLAARMPAWATPDLLTGFALVASVLIFASYVLTNVDKG
ncbi:MAG TPA: hypothetical protein VN648_15835, partial [Candidatus Methylomirabilis sp.]|nr:hypothetical protein [Candidatus Methylomirabilis sp.]